MSRALMRRRVRGVRIEEDPPVLVLKSILEFAGKVPDGRLVSGVAIPWLEIMAMLKRDPSGIYQLTPDQFEEIIAGAYDRAGYDEVILTPRSGDRGRDVIATKNGVGSIRIFDQVKLYRPRHLVPAEDVRALFGVVSSALNVSKGVITTTSDFAPGIASDPFLAPLIPHRIELKPRDILFPWLESLSRKKPSSGDSPV